MSEQLLNHPNIGAAVEQMGRERMPQYVRRHRSRDSGPFGEDDKSPSPGQVAQHEVEPRRHGKTYDFHIHPARQQVRHHQRPTHDMAGLRVTC